MQNVFIQTATLSAVQRAFVSRGAAKNISDVYRTYTRPFALWSAHTQVIYDAKGGKGL